MAVLDKAKAHFAAFGVQSIEVAEWGAQADGLSAIQRVTAHFASLKTQMAPVPEWDETVYWTPASLAERQRIWNTRQEFGKIASQAEVLVLKALDSAGNKLFTIEAKRTLRREVDPDVIAGLVDRMMEPAKAEAEPKGEPLKIYWKPMTLAEKQELDSIGRQDGFVLRLADCLAMKATGADGKRLFAPEDLEALRTKADPDVIARVVLRMTASPGVQEMGKS